jgi:hypothetical protein
MSRFTDELIGRELIPNWSGDVEGHRLTVNRLGLRDRLDRTREKPPGTYRVAVVGSSVVMGYGVDDDATFPRLVEERLNAARTTGPRYELVNFGMGRSNPIQRRVLIDRRVWAFQPDAIYYVAHQDELLTAVDQLTKVLSSHTPPPYPCLRDVARAAGITPDTQPAIVEARLQPFARDIVFGLYRDLVAECRRRGVKPVWIYLPMPGVVEVPARSAEFVQLAEEAGFAVVNLADWADGRRPAEVRLGELDHHANTLGHRIIADKLGEVLRQRPELLSGIVHP